ncbi:hypothetical protein C7E12_19725, partial [Stenotrophomonas maltophilia]
RHASSSAPRPQLPAQLAGHRVLCSDCASLSEVRPRAWHLYGQHAHRVPTAPHGGIPQGVV